MAETVGLRVEDPRFWDPQHLRGEIDRVFSLDHYLRNVNSIFERVFR